MFDARSILDALTAGTSQATEGTRTKAPDIATIAREIFGRATSGVQDAAGDINSSTGAGAQIDQKVRELTGGQSAGDLLKRAKQWAGDNPGAAGAIAAGLGALVLGTKTGRSLSMDAAKLGGLVLVGGLAYDAYKKYQAGAGAADNSGGAASSGSNPYGIPSLPPVGSGFEAEAQSDDDALVYVKAMIGAAAADGAVDAAERAQILGGLRQAGVDGASADVLDELFANPPTPANLAQGVSSLEQASRIYTAARVAIEPDTARERQFLADLASAMGMDPALVAAIDGEVRSVRV